MMLNIFWVKNTERTPSVRVEIAEGIEGLKLGIRSIPHYQWGLENKGIHNTRGGE